MDNTLFRIGNNKFHQYIEMRFRLGHFDVLNPTRHVFRRRLSGMFNIACHREGFI